jgi:hypothetical protein
MPQQHEAVSAPEPSHETVWASTSRLDDFPGDRFLSPDFVKHYRGPWCWPFPKPAMASADLRAAMLHAADCLDASLDAQVDGDEAELLRNLETVNGCVAVVIDRLRGSSDNRVLQ